MVPLPRYSEMDWDEMQERGDYSVVKDGVE